MYYPIDEIDGLSERLGAGLARAGIRTTRDLLSRAAQAQDRDTLARAIGVGPAELQRAVEIADLLRVKGVARRYAALLHAAEVCIVHALRNQHPDALFEAVAAAKARVRSAYRLPTPGNVRAWIEDAAELQPIVT